MWFAFASTSALLYAFRGLFEKKVVAHTNKYVLGLAVRLFALPFFLVPFFFKPDLVVPISDLGADFWIPIIIVCFVATPLETVFYYEALREEELSLALPILSLSPIVTVLVAAGFLHEYPSIIGMLGILIILFAIYSLKISHAKEGLLEPLKHLHKSRGVRLMLVVMLSLGIGTILDKIAIRASNPFVYTATNYLLVSFSLFVMAWIKARKDLWQLSRNFALFSLIGLFVAGYTIFYALALNSGNPSYVIAIRNASILFTILFGIVLLKEKGGRSKLLAGALLVLGLICIKVFG